MDGTEAENAQPEDDRIPVVALDGPDQLTPSANTDGAAQAAEQDEKDEDEPKFHDAQAPGDDDLATDSDKATPVGAKIDDSSETTSDLDDKPKYTSTTPAKKATGAKK